MPGTSSLAAPLLVALAKLGLSSEQLSRIKGKLVVELQQRRLQHQTACCTVEVSLHLHALLVQPSVLLVQPSVLTVSFCLNLCPGEPQV